MLYGLSCLIRERLCIQFYVWNIWPPRFPFWTVWLHLVIIFISLKESAEQWPLWRRHLIRPPLPPPTAHPHLPGGRGQASERRERERRASLSVMHQFGKEHGLLSPCGAPTPGKPSRDQLLYFSAPLFLIPMWGPGAFWWKFCSLSLSNPTVSLIPQCIPNPFWI